MPRPRSFNPPLDYAACAVLLGSWIRRSRYGVFPDEILFISRAAPIGGMGEGGGRVRARVETKNRKIAAATNRSPPLLPFSVNSPYYENTTRTRARAMRYI